MEKDKIATSNAEGQNSIVESKMKIPLDIQKSMLEFFARTSIPRKKAKQTPLPQRKEEV